MAKKDEIVKTGEDVPSYLKPVEKGAVAEGMENIRPGDILVPRLVLLQALSPSVSANKNRAGELINSVTGEVCLENDKSLIFHPVYHYLEWIKWGDRDQGGGIQERSLDPKGELAQMAFRREKHQDSQGKDVFTSTEYHNFVALVPALSLEQAYIISCSKTNLKKAKKLLGLAKFRGGQPLYAGAYSVSTLLETNAKINAKYYTFEFENAGWIPEELLPLCKKMYETMRDAYQSDSLQAHVEDQDPAGESTETEL